MLNDVVTWGAVVLAIGTVIAIVKMSNFYSDRISKVEERAKAAIEIAKEAKVEAAKASDQVKPLAAAIEIAKEAKADARESNDKVTLLSASFGIYREQIAKEYIHREVMREVEERLTAAIDRLGDRLDRVLERSELNQPHHRQPPHRG